MCLPITEFGNVTDTLDLLFVSFPSPKTTPTFLSGLPASSVNDHYRTHRMSFWQNLIPKLQIHGKEESDSFRRHLQDQQGKSGILGTTAGGSNPNEVAFFERISLKFLDNLKPPPDPSSDSIRTGSLHDSSGVNAHNNNNNNANHNNNLSHSTKNGNPDHQSSNSNQHHSTSKGKTTLIVSESTDPASFSYLYPTLVIGITLVSINIMVFLLLYLKMNKHADKRRNIRDRRSQSNASNHSSSPPKRSSGGNYVQCHSNTNSLNRRSSNNGLHPSNSIRRTSAGNTISNNTLPRSQGIQQQQQQQTIQQIHTSPAHNNHGSHVHSLHGHHHQHSLQQHLHEEDTLLIPTSVQSLSYPFSSHHQVNYVTDNNDSHSYDTNSSTVDNFNDKLLHEQYSHHHHHQPHVHLQQNYQQQQLHVHHGHQHSHHHHPTVTFNDYITHLPPPPASQAVVVSSANNLVVKYSSNTVGNLSTPSPNNSLTDMMMTSGIMTNGVNGGGSSSIASDDHDSSGCCQIIQQPGQLHPPDLYGSPSHGNNCDKTQQQQLTVIQEIQGEEDHL